MKNVEVTDMYLCASLFAYGAEYQGVDREDKRNQKFLFAEPLGIDKIYTLRHDFVMTVENPSFDDFKRAFDTSILLYPPQYVEALRRVKGIIHT